MKASLNYSLQNNNQLYWSSLTLERLTALQESLKSGAQKLSKELISLFTVSTEPVLWKSTDSQSQEVWSAYEESSGKRIQNLSEADMRIWLENRHNL